MPKYRQLHTKIIDSFDFNGMPDDFHRVSWILLSLIVDAEGRGIDSAPWIRSKMYPLREDITLEQVTCFMDWIAQRGMIVRYTVDGKAYFFVVNFKTYQTGTDRESKSVLPTPVPVKQESKNTPELVLSNSGVTPDEDMKDSLPNESESESINNDTEGKPGELAELEEAFVSASKLPVLSGGLKRSVDAYKRMKDADVTPADIAQAVNILQDKSYQINGPASIVNTAISLVAKRKREAVKKGQTPQGDTWFYG